MVGIGSELERAAIAPQILRLLEISVDIVNPNVVLGQPASIMRVRDLIHEPFRTDVGQV